MKKVVLISASVLLALLVLGGAGITYYILTNQDRGMSADGRMLPPPSARNAEEAPKFGAAKTSATAPAEKGPDYQLPTEFKLPTELDITPPAVPEGLGDPANSKKS
jgi:hypothetical protein